MIVGQNNTVVAKIVSPASDELRLLKYKYKYKNKYTNTIINTKTNVYLEEPKGYEGEKVESNCKLLPREWTKSVVLAMKEPGV